MQMQAQLHSTRAAFQVTNVWTTDAGDCCISDHCGGHPSRGRQIEELEEVWISAVDGCGLDRLAPP